MTRRLVRIARAELHPGVAVVFDARSGARIDQLAIAAIEPILGHRKQAYFMAEVGSGCVKLYEEVPQEAVDAIL